MNDKNLFLFFWYFFFLFIKKSKSIYIQTLLNTVNHSSKASLIMTGWDFDIRLWWLLLAVSNSLVVMQYPDSGSGVFSALQEIFSHMGKACFSIFLNSLMSFDRYSCILWYFYQLHFMVFLCVMMLSAKRKVCYLFLMKFCKFGFQKKSVFFK